ncbi:MAG TPA: sulfurtransferase [Steroidobacteraceae bacterium]|nr:sulfurtransferase [Steroidobacteraceae bacterium]
MPFTTLIDAASLAALPGPAVLLDCRFDLSDPRAGRRAYAAGHIPGARYADLNLDLSSPPTSASGRHPLPSPEALAAFFAAAGIGDETQVIAYDDANGSYAARAWWLLKWLGHIPVAVLDGGFKAWVAAGGAAAGAPAAGAPVEAGEPPPRAPGAAPRFTVRLRPQTVLTTADVLRGLADPRRLLVDARAAERFAGTVEPVDPVPGHVPGAVNHPFAANLRPDGRFLPEAELRRRWLAVLGGRESKDAVLMCGSGVTACHNILAMTVAGLPDGKLYAGSWSEWIRDPERPVARGP